MADKKELRLRHMALRDEMQEDETKEKSRIICERLLTADWYKEAEIIYSYYPLGKEVDCKSFLLKALSDGKMIALPKTKSKDCSMEFYQITSLDQVREGSFHVQEPLEGCPIIQEHVAIVLVPGLVFDKKGNRYGYGKGYYDRYFYRFPKLWRFALSYEQQIEQDIPVNYRDVNMQRIYTEAGVYRLDS